MKNAKSDPPRFKRKKRLIDRRLQLRFVATFAATAGLAVLVQTIVMGYVLASIIEAAPNDKLMLMSAAPKMLATGVVASFALMLPATVLLGIHMTFPIAGPLYRFRQYLGSVSAGERPGPCRIRQGDELQDLCDLINSALASYQTEIEELVEDLADGGDMADDERERAA